MECVNYKTEFSNIPEQDFIHRGNIAIVKDARNRCYNTELNRYNGHVVLLKPEVKGDLVSLGLFWTEENAILFADAYIKKHSPKEVKIG
jgi:hypothetical protein